MTRVRFPSPAPSDKYRAGSVLSDPVFCFLLRFSSFARNRGLQARKRGRPIIANGVRPPHRAPRSLPSRIHPAPRHLASSAWKPSALKRGTCFGGQRERVCRFGALPNPHPSPTLVDLSKPCAAARFRRVRAPTGKAAPEVAVVSSLERRMPRPCGPGHSGKRGSCVFRRSPFAGRRRCRLIRTEPCRR